MSNQRRFSFFAILLASSLAAGSSQADINPRKLVNQAAASVHVMEPGILSELSPQHLEAAGELLNRIDRTALCEHLNVSKARFEEVLGTTTTEMQSIRIALEALKETNVKHYCRGA